MSSQTAKRGNKRTCELNYQRNKQAEDEDVDIYQEYVNFIRSISTKYSCQDYSVRAIQGLINME